MNGNGKDNGATGDTTRVKKLYDNLQKQGIVNDLPEFSKFKEDMRSQKAQRNVYSLLKQTGVNGLPEFEKFQSDVFGRPTPTTQQPSSTGVDQQAQQMSWENRYDRRMKTRRDKWRQRAEKLNKEAQEIEDEATTKLMRIPGARSIPDPELKKKAYQKRRERDRLLGLANENESLELQKYDTGQSRLSSAGSQFVRGLAETLGEDTMKSAAVAGTYIAKKIGDMQGKNTEHYNPEQHPWYKQGQELGDAVREMFPTNPAFQKEFLSSVLPQGAGSMAAFLAGGAGSKLLKGGSLGAGILGSASVSSQEFQRAMDETGGDTEKAFQTWLLNLPVGATEMIPIGRMLNRFDKVTGGGIKRVLADGFKGGVEELTQEVGQQFLSNATGKALIDDTRSLVEGLREGGAAGFVLGAVMNGAGRAIANARSNAATEEEKRAADRAKEILDSAREDIGNVKINDQKGATMDAARNDMESVDITGQGEPKTIRPEAKVTFDPSAPPAEQIEQLKSERARIKTEMERAKANDENIEDFQNVISRVDESIDLLEEGARVDEQEGTTPETPQPTQQSEGLTQEARDFLTVAGGAEGNIPSFVNERMKKMAEDNGIPVNEDTTPEQIVEGLQSRQSETATDPTGGEQQAEQSDQNDVRDTIGQDVAGEMQGEFSDKGLSIAARTQDGDVVVRPRDQVATHAQLAAENELDVEQVEMGFVSPSGKFLNRNEGLQWQKADQPGFESTAPGVVFAEEVNPQEDPVEFTTTDEQFRVRPTEEGLEVTGAATDEQFEQGSQQFSKAAGEYFAAETAEAGKVTRQGEQNDMEFLSAVAENSSNPVQIASALQQAQEMQEGSSESNLQNNLRSRFKDITGVDLSPQLAEQITQSKTTQEQAPTSQSDMAAMRGEPARMTVGSQLGEKSGRELTPEQVLGAIDGGQFFGGSETTNLRLKEDAGHMSRETVVYMSPQEFLDMAAPVDGGVYREESLRHQKEQIEKGKKFDNVPFLKIEQSGEGSGTYQVQGHEGRHRAKALLDAGIEKMPVRISTPSLRWGNTDTRPTTLRGQLGNSQNEMEMPESVFYPKDIDKRNSASTGKATEQPQMTRTEMGSGATPGTGGSPLTGAGQRQENLNEDWTLDPQPLREIVDDLVNSAGLTLRQGRMSLKEALGQYSLKSGVTRVQVRDALEVVAHEAGHDIDDNYTSEIKTLTDLHSDEIRPLAYPQAAPNQKTSEGFAEFFRLYITNPGYAEAAAPNFYNDFRNWLSKLDNNMYEDFERIRGAYQAFLNQPSDAAVESDVVQSDTKFEEITKKVEEDGVWGIVKNNLGKFYRSAVGEDDILRLARNQLLDIHYENTGENLEISPLMDFYKLNRISLDSYSAGAMDIEHGVENYNTAEAEGASLRDALHTALGKDWSEKHRKEFSAYLVSRRAVNEWQRFNEGKMPNRPTKLTKKDHELNIKTKEAQYPEFRKAAEQINEYGRNLWKKLRDSGLISDEAYNSGIDEHPFYVPFARDMSDQTKVRTEGKNKTGKNTVLKAFKGSDRPILDPIEQMMKMTYEFNMLIKANDTKRALLDMANTAGSGSGAVAEEIPASQVKGIPIDTEQVIKQLSEVTDWEQYGLRDAMGQLLKLTSLDNVDIPDLTMFKQGEINEKGEPIVFAWEDGKRRAIRLADDELGMEMYNVLTSQHSAARDMTTNALAYPASWLRTGVTTEPSFFIANLIRDQVSAWILTDVGFKPFGSIANDLNERTKETLSSKIEGFNPKLASSEAVDTETQKEYSRLYRNYSGISTFNVAALDETRAKSEVKKLKQKNIPIRRLESVRGLNELLDLSEIGTRLGVFQRASRRAKERGLSKKEAAIEAGFMARDLIDFGRHGSRLSATRRLLPFFNAAIQGLDKGVRVLSAEGNLWKAITPYIKDVNGRPLNKEERGQVDLAKKAWLKTMEIGMIGASLAAMYWDDPEYDEMPDYLKNTHWVFRNPAFDEKSGEMSKWVAVPKPFELAFLSNTMESLITSYANDDPEWASEWGKSIWEVVAPPISPVGLQVPAEVWANKRKFDGRPIVYERLLGREPWQQYNSYTSEFGKWMGKQINVSPAVIDHVITGTFGSWGRSLLSATSAAKPNAPANGWDDTWVARRFVRSADRGNKSSKQFWSQLSRDEGEMTSAAGTFKAFFDQGVPQDAFQYYDKLPLHEKLYVAMKYVKDDNSELLPVVEQDHPLDNARKASSLISGIRTDLIEDKGVFETVSSKKKQGMDDVLDRLATVEYRNSLIASGLPKYSDRKPMDFNEVLNIIRSDYPTLHQELVKRYAESKLKMNPTDQYQRFAQYANTPGLADKLLPIVQYQREQIKQQQSNK